MTAPAGAHQERRAGLRAAAWPLALVAVGTVLRLPGTFRRGLGFDESFTALAAHRPMAAALRFIRAEDAHGPLDLVLRAVQVREGWPAWTVRAPTLVLAVAGMCVLVRWWWPHGLAGRLAACLAVVSATQVEWGGEARPYASLLLAMPLVGLAHDRWTTAGRRRWLAVAALAVSAASWSHGGGFVLGAAAGLAVGWRRDAASWWWRAACWLPSLLYLAVWALPSPNQAARHAPRFASPWSRLDALAVAVNEQASYYPSLRWLLVPAAATGALLLLRRRHPLGPMAVALGPAAWSMALVGSARADLLQPRALVCVGPAVCLGLAGAVDALARRWRPLAVVAGAAVVIPVLGSVAKGWPEGEAEGVVAVERAAAMVGPGDVLAFAPARLGTLPAWQLGLRGRGFAPVSVGDADLDGLVRAGAPVTGRVLVVEHPAVAAGLRPGMSACGPVLAVERFRVQCGLVDPAGVRARSWGWAQDERR